MKPTTPYCDRCIFREDTAIKTYCNNPDSIHYKKVPYPNQKACARASLKEKEKEVSVIARMRHNVMAYNKNIDKHELRKKTPLELLQLVHQLDRRDFAIALCKAHIVKTEDVAYYLKP